MNNGKDPTRIHGAPSAFPKSLTLTMSCDALPYFWFLKEYFLPKKRKENHRTRSNGTSISLHVRSEVSYLIQKKVGIFEIFRSRNLKKVTASIMANSRLLSPSQKSWGSCLIFFQPGSLPFATNINLQKEKRKIKILYKINNYRGIALLPLLHFVYIKSF